MKYEVWFYKGDKKIAEKTYKTRDRQSLMAEIFLEDIDADNYFIIERRKNEQKSWLWETKTKWIF